MSAGGHMAAMQVAIKNNDRRKSKNKPFKNYIAKYTKAKTILLDKTDIPHLFSREEPRFVDTSGHRVWTA